MKRDEPKDIKEIDGADGVSDSTDTVDKRTTDAVEEVVSEDEVSKEPALESGRVEDKNKRICNVIGNKKLLVLVCGGILVVLFCVIWLLYGVGEEHVEKLKLNIGERNGALKLGQELSEDELNALYADMNHKVKESEIAYKVNASPVLNKGQMNILFESPSINVNLLTFSVCLDDSNDILYMSKEALLPGSSIEFIDVEKRLLPGEYKGYVSITSYHIETHEKIGETIAEIEIYVL